jgi:mannosylglucosylglycerate synthase
LLRYPWQGVRYVVVSEARRRELQELWSVSRAEFAGGPVPVGPGDGGVPDREAPPPEGGMPAADWSAGISIVPPGIDPLEFLGVTPETSAWVRRFGLLDADPLLLLPARLTRRKNIEYAIEIVAALHAAGRPAKLVVTGPPGPHNPTNAAYLAHLESLRESRGLGSHVIFLHRAGAVDAGTLRDLYLLADAVLFPSEREGFGLPLLEAGLTRAPIFCSDIAPFRRVAGESAVYLIPESAGHAAEQISAALEGDRAYRFKRQVAREYSWERIFADRIEPLAKN